MMEPGDDSLCAEEFCVSEPWVMGKEEVCP